MRSTVLLILAVLAGCQRSASPSPTPSNPSATVPSTITVTSSAFSDGQPIPTKYTADGQDISPPLAWTNLPPKTQGLALVVDDPDAPGSTPFCHWVVIMNDFPTQGLKEGASDLPSTALQGQNGFGTTGYHGPDPPSGAVHHYHFRVFALDLWQFFPDRRFDRKEALAALSSHILAQGELIGTYQRQ